MPIEDREWDLLMKEIRTIRDEQKDLLVTVTTLKVKLGFISGIFGTLGGIITALLNTVINKHV